MTEAEKLAALSEAELLPCPFCGVAVETSHQAGSAWFADCDHAEGCFFADFQRTESDFKAAWNTRANHLAVIGPDAVEVAAQAIYQAMNGHIATAHTWEQLEPEPKAFWRDKATAAFAAPGVT